MNTFVANIVDQLGILKAQIATLAVQEKQLKEALLHHGGIGAHEGYLFDATVSVADRDTLDMKAVREKLTPQFIRAHTNTTEVTTIRVVARVAGRKAA